MHWDGSDHIYSILPRQYLDRYVRKVVHKRLPYISIAPTDAFMVIPATIIPKSIILVKYAIKARGEWIPGFIDPAANQRSQTDGQRVIELYRRLGLHIENAAPPRLSVSW